VVYGDHEVYNDGLEQAKQDAQNIADQLSINNLISISNAETEEIVTPPSTNSDLTEEITPPAVGQ
jgi:hypothetical protein